MSMFEGPRIPTAWLIASGAMVAAGSMWTAYQADEIKGHDSYTNLLASHGLTEDVVKNTLSVDSSIDTAKKHLEFDLSNCRQMLPDTSTIVCQATLPQNADESLPYLEEAKEALTSLGDPENASKIEEIEASVRQEQLPQLELISEVENEYSEKAGIIAEKNADARIKSSRVRLASSIGATGVSILGATTFASFWVHDLSKWRRNGGRIKSGFFRTQKA